MKAILLALLLILAPANSYVIKGGDITVSCPLTVGGSFEASTKSLSGTLTGPPANLSGTLTVDLTTLTTGIDIRDHHLKDTYLQVAKYPKASMTAIKVSGDEFTALLTVHGTRHSVSGKVSSSGDKYNVTFPLNISDYKIAKPTYLGIGVSNTITLKVSFTASN